MSNANGALQDPLVVKQKGVKFQDVPEEQHTVLNVRDSTPLFKRKLRRLMSNPHDELKRFRLSLFWTGLDQSTVLRVAFSWVLFIVFTVVIPVLNQIAVTCSKCDFEDLAFERLGSISESLLATVSFLCLSYLLRVLGLRKVLLLDKLDREPEEIQQGYRAQVDRSFILLACILLPSTIVKFAHEIWWFSSVSVNLPFISHGPVLRFVMWLLVMLSWFHKSLVFLLMCVLFRLMCSLQTHRLEGYNKLLEETEPTEAADILLKHVITRKQLVKISHRFRLFMVLSMVVITTSQFVSLFFILSYKESVHFFRAGSLAVCSAVQLSGFLVVLNGASKITHLAQKIVSLVSEWSAIGTCNLVTHHQEARVKTAPCYPLVRTKSDISSFEVDREGGAFDSGYHFRQRQALLTYLQHNSAGVSVYGFILDRGFLYTLFALELSLVMWILGKTITGIR